MRPSSGEITVFIRHWYLSLRMGDKCQCLIDTVIPPDDGRMDARNM